MTKTEKQLLPPRLIRRGMNYSILSAVLWSFFFAAASGPVLAGLMIALKMSNFQIGLVMSMTMLFLPFQIMGAVIQQRYFHRKRFWFISVFTQYFAYFVLVLLIAGWAMIPAPLAVMVFLIIFGLAQMAAQMVSSVFLAWMGELVPQRESNSFWNSRQGWSMIAIMVSSVCAGLLVDLMGREHRWTYAVVMAIGVIFGFGALAAQAMVPDPDPCNNSRSPLLLKIRQTWRNEQVRKLIIFFSFQSLIAWLACPFIFIYLQKSMELSMTTVQLLIACSSTVSFFSGYLFRVIGNKYGRKPVLLLCTFLKGIEFIFWGTMLPESGWIGALPAFIMGGFVNMGIGSSQLSLLTSVENKRNKSFSIAVFFAINGLCGFISSSMSGVVYDWLDSLEWVTAIPLTPFNLMSLVVSLGYFTSILLFLSFREDGAAPTGRVVRVLLSNNPFRSIYHAHVLSQPMTENTRVETLEKTKGNLIAAELIHDLYSPSSRVRESVVWSIARNEQGADPVLEEELLKIMDMPELGIQAPVARALGHLRSQKAVPVLVKYLKGGDVTLAQSCIFALGLIGDTAAVTELDSMFDHERYRLLWPLAAEALGKLGDFRHTRHIYRAYQGEYNWVIKKQILIAMTRTIATDKTIIHAKFEAEEKLPGCEIERLLKAHQGHPEKRNDKSIEADTFYEELMNEYDHGRLISCLEKILLRRLKEFGIIPQTDKGIHSAAILSNLFASSGNIRNPVLNQNTYPAAALWLMLNLWAEMKYSPSGFDRYLLLAALTAGDALQSTQSSGHA